MDASKLLANYKVVPVIVINDVNKARRLTEALLQRDLGCIEITLRTPNALACIETLANSYPEAVVGAGSVVTPDQLRAAESAGIKFAVSPGYSAELLNAAKTTPLVPGGATASEVMHLKAAGYRTVKFFPAEILGGIKAIRALSEPIQDVQFFPTGGVRENNLAEYLDFDRVACVGGSWLAPSDDVENDRWDEIESRCDSLQTVLSDLS